MADQPLVGIDTSGLEEQLRKANLRINSLDDRVRLLQSELEQLRKPPDPPDPPPKNKLWMRLWPTRKLAKPDVPQVFTPPGD